MFEKNKSAIGELLLGCLPSRCLLTAAMALPVTPQINLETLSFGGDNSGHVEASVEPLAALRVLPGNRKNHGKSILPISRWSAEDRETLSKGFLALQSLSPEVKGKLSELISPTLIGKDLPAGTEWSQSSSEEKQQIYYYLANVSHWIGLNERELRILDEVIYSRSGFNPRYAERDRAGLAGLAGEVRATIANDLFKLKGSARVDAEHAAVLSAEQEVQVALEFYLKEVRPEVMKSANWESRSDYGEILISTWIQAEQRIHVAQLSKSGASQESTEMIEDRYAILEKKLQSLFAERSGKGTTHDKVYASFLSELQKIRSK